VKSDGTPFEITVPLDRGKKVIEDLDIVMHFDQTNTFNKNEYKKFAKMKDKDVEFEKTYLMTPPEARPKIIEKKLETDAKNEKDEESSKNE